MTEVRRLEVLYMCYEWFDKDKIMRDADPYQIALSIGMETKKKGKYVFIRCPGHAKRLGHEDAHMGNAYLTRKGYYCHSCGKAVDAITMVMEYLGCDYAEALSTIADINGNREMYYDDEKMDYNTNKKAKKEKMKHPPMISHEEQLLIGLCPKYERTKIPISFSSYGKDGYERYDIKSCTGYLKYSTNPEDRMNLSSLYKEDYDMYRCLIARKCLEAIDKYENTIKLLPEYGKLFPALATADMQIGLQYVLTQYCKKIWKILDNLFPQTTQRNKAA